MPPRSTKTLWQDKLKDIHTETFYIQVVKVQSLGQVSGRLIRMPARTPPPHIRVPVFKSQLCFLILWLKIFLCLVTDLGNKIFNHLCHLEFGDLKQFFPSASALMKLCDIHFEINLQGFPYKDTGDTATGFYIHSTSSLLNCLKKVKALE